MPSLQNLPRELRSSQVLIRFGLRVAILVCFAAFSHVGFGRSLAALLLPRPARSSAKPRSIRFSTTGTKRWLIRGCIA
jgi:hypothetical protein